MARGDTARALGVTITSDEQAREIAAQWQSPGTIGHVLAALASGVTVDREELWLDIDTTLHHDNPTGEDREALVALQEWADNEHNYSPLLRGVNGRAMGNRRVTRTWSGLMIGDNHPVPRSQWTVTAKVYAATDWSAETTVLAVEGSEWLDCHRAVYLIDDGATVTPLYVAGWHDAADGKIDRLFLQPFPVNPDGRTRPDGRVIDYSTWQLGPRRCYHVKVTS